jgi:hypothetical protein
MARTLSELLGSIPDEAGRNEVLQLGRHIHEAARSERNAQNVVEQQQLIQAMTERIRWHFRAARYAVPGAGELQRMIDDHFR